MKKLISTVWPFLHASLGFLVVGALGRTLFALRVPFSADTLMHGPIPYTTPWPIEYAFVYLLAGIPGVLYAAAVAAASETTRRATFIMATVYTLVTITIVSVALYNRSRGVSIYPSLTPLGAVTTLGAMFVFGLCVSLFTHGLNRKKRLLAATILILLSFVVIAAIPRGLVTWHKASLCRLRPGLLSLDPYGDEHYLLRVRHEGDKYALVQLDYIHTLDFVPREGTTKSQESNLWEDIRSNIGDAAYVDAIRTTTGAELPNVQGGPPKETPLFRIWDRPIREQFWTDLARKHGMERLANKYIDRYK